MLTAPLLLQFFLFWRWRQQAPSKQRYVSAGLHGVVSRMTLIFRAVCRWQSRPFRFRQNRFELKETDFVCTCIWRGTKGDCGRLPAEIVGSNPKGGMDVCCVLSGRGLCDELITRPEESYRLWCVVMCDLETSRMRSPWPALGRSATGKKRGDYWAW